MSWAAEMEETPSLEKLSKDQLNLDKFFESFQHLQNGDESTAKSTVTGFVQHFRKHEEGLYFGRLRGNGLKLDLLIGSRNFNSTEAFNNIVRNLVLRDLVYVTGFPRRNSSGDLGIIVMDIETLKKGKTHQGPSDCNTCGVHFRTIEEQQGHWSLSSHIKNNILETFNENLPIYSSSENGLTIDVSHDAIKVDEGNIELTCEQNTPATFSITLRNISQTNVYLFPIELVCEENVANLRPSGVKKELKPGKDYEVFLEVCSSHVGIFNVPLVIHYYREYETSNNMRVVNSLIKVETCELRTLRPMSEYIPPKDPAVRVNRFVVKEKSTDESEENESFLSSYRIGEDIRDQIQANFQARQLTSEDMRNQEENLRLLESSLLKENIRPKLNLELMCEQVATEIESRKFNKSGIELPLILPAMVKLQLSVDQRPSHLRVGDQIRIGETGGQSLYPTTVNEVSEDKFSVTCGDKLINLLQSTNLKYDVVFIPNDYSSRLCHRAVDSSDGNVKARLFPTADLEEKEQIGSTEKELGKNLEFLNEFIHKNPEQSKAVSSIVSLSGPTPYLIFGPPGTGKTVTVVEAINQVYIHHPGCRILVTAPSNTAADLLAQRLSDSIPKGQLLRLLAKSHSLDSMPPGLLNFSNIEEETIYYPSRGELGGYRIIVSTLVNCGRFTNLKLPGYFFDFVFIDEAGQATEPETMIPLCMAKKARWILAGDPCQLGPVIMSHLARKGGLQISTMERLMNTIIYKPTEEGYNAKLIVKLTQNFRSHATLLELPSRLFYRSELIAAADPLIVNSCLHFPALTEMCLGKTPLLFHGVMGEDVRESESSSYFNPCEAVIVLHYVEQVLAMGMIQKEIGVIAPYRKMVKKLLELFSSKGLEKITIGSTEQLQGLERQVIVLTTVRSSSNSLLPDPGYKSGFLSNPKRFNVAITRARALFIIVGNPFVLQQDEEWKALLKFSIERGGLQRLASKPGQLLSG